jgi:aminoglycoside 3-N-acetyltransferase
MIKLFNELLKVIDGERLLANTEKLWKIELGQCHRNCREAAKFTERLMQESGLKQVERIAFPADGKTSYGDKTMPLAWDATMGRLTVIHPSASFENPVVADFSRHPFHLARGSVSTPPGGIVTRLITEEQLFGGCEAANAMVIPNPETRPRADLYARLCDLGALGVVNSWLQGRYETPDAIHWVNGFADGPQWHVLADDRPLIGFSVSPRTGDALRAAARAGDVLVRVESDGRLYEDELDVVTGILPGRDPREVWTLAHLYEPLANDNSTGVIAGIEIARALQKMIQAGTIPPLRFTLRLLCGAEMYGFAAYADRRGGQLRNQVIGAVNLDALPVTPDGRPAWVNAAPPATAFFGNYLLEQLVEQYRGQGSPALGNIAEFGVYGDDTVLSDRTNSVPMIYISDGAKFWHNSAQDMTVIDKERFKRATALTGACAAKWLLFDPATSGADIAAAGSIACGHLHREARQVFEEMIARPPCSEKELTERARRRMKYRLAHESRQLSDFKRVGDCPEIREALAQLREEKKRVCLSLERQLREWWSSQEPSQCPAPENPWLEYAATVRPSRATAGLPHDLRRVPKAERRALPEQPIWGPVTRILANMDGRKTLKDLLLEVEWESRTQFNPWQVKRCLNVIGYLGDWGYLDVKYDSEIRREKIVRALRQAGLKRGDLVLAHTGVSHFGRIRGGAETVLDAFLEVLGEKGTLLLPAFTSPAIFFEGFGSKNRRYRPHEADRPELVGTGRLPRLLLTRSGAVRSRHCTHSVVGIGPLAEACLSEHREDDPPTSRRSAFGKLVDHGGKMVWFGAGLGSTTFFHFLETELDMPYLRSALCCVKEGDRVRTVFVPKHLPGHRDFYRGEESKMYQRLIAMGLDIQKVTLGLGAIKVIEARQMYELGMRALREDPDLLLCDNDNCLFCSRYRKPAPPAGKPAEKGDLR